MKKTKKSSSKSRRPRKPIMRHSRESVKAAPRKRRVKRGAASKPRRKAAPKARARAKARSTRKKSAAKKSPPTAPRPRGLRPWETDRRLSPRSGSRGIGAAAAGQAGDLEDIPREEDVDSESVEELLEEGQAFEAGIVEGVEEADDEAGEIHTREVPTDDVPDEYLDEEE